MNETIQLGSSVRFIGLAMQEVRPGTKGVVIARNGERWVVQFANCRGGETHRISLWTAEMEMVR